MDQPKRKHVRTGRKPPGGKRPGAGRPPGSPNTLEYGEVKAVKSLRWRVPDSVPEAVAAVADEAFDKAVAVMRGEVSYMDAGHVLKAATRLREEICGPLAQKHEHAGAGGEPLAVSISINRTVKK